MSSEHLTEASGAVGVGSLGLAERLTLPIFAVTIFLGAFLLFSVQPMIAKMVLPLLGGSPSVWNTAMVFFQAALLAGYAYAHFGVRWLGLRRQSLLRKRDRRQPRHLSRSSTIHRTSRKARTWSS